MLRRKSLEVTKNSDHGREVKKTRKVTGERREVIDRKQERFCRKLRKVVR